MDFQEHYDSLIFTGDFLEQIVESQHSSVLLQQTMLNSCILVLAVTVTMKRCPQVMASTAHVNKSKDGGTSVTREAKDLSEP